jgi:hypothetical protein
MVELKDTITLMNSEYYKDRFVAEYIQLKTRYEKLKTFNQRIEVARLTGMEEPKHDCPLDLLKQQQSVMGEYLHLLELRAKIEHINLTTAMGRLEVSNKPVDTNIDPTTSTSSGDTDGDTKVTLSDAKVTLKEKRNYKKQATSEVVD